MAARGKTKKKKKIARECIKRLTQNLSAINHETSSQIEQLQNSLGRVTFSSQSLKVSVCERTGVHGNVSECKEMNTHMQVQILFYCLRWGLEVPAGRVMNTMCRDPFHY